MRAFFILISFFTAVFLEWTFGSASFGGITPPLTLGVIIFWFLRLEFVGRMWLSVLAGFFLDSISVLPFGTYLISLFLLGLAAEFVRHLFSSRESTANAAGLALLLFFVLFSLSVFSSPVVFPSAFSSALVWSSVSFLTLSGALRIQRVFS